MTTMSVSPDTPPEHLASPAFWAAIKDASIFLERAFLGEIAEPDRTPEPDDRPADADACTFCSGTGGVNAVRDEWGNWDADECGACGGSGEATL